MPILQPKSVISAFPHLYFLLGLYVPFCITKGKKSAFCIIFIFVYLFVTVIHKDDKERTETGLGNDKSRIQMLFSYIEHHY